MPDLHQLTAATAALVSERTYAGLIGLPGCRVVSVNGSTGQVGFRTEQLSGAFVTIKHDGAWLYEPPAAALQLESGQQAIDCFHCETETDGRTQRHTICVSLNSSGSASPILDVQRLENPFEQSSTAPVRIFVKALSLIETEIDLRVASGHSADESPAVLILAQSPDGNARVCENSGHVVFKPNGGFLGATELRCLVENRNRSATFVVVHLDVQSAAQIHVRTAGS